jgi:hypothetical protein
MKGYKVDTDSYIEVTKDELENIAVDSNRTIDIDEFVPKADIDPRYLIRPLFRARRQSRSRRIRRYSRNHPQHGHDRHRAACVDQPRTHHWVRAAEKWTDGQPAPLPLPSPIGKMSISTTFKM